MPVIRIGDSTWERLKLWAVPLEDTPEDAVCKVLNAAEEHLKCNQMKPVKAENEERIKVMTQGERSIRGLKTPVQAYHRPILEALTELGGRGRVNQVLSIVEKKMKSILVPFDYEKMQAGSVRWVNTAQWGRFNLFQEGLLKPNSPKGIWELSDKGVQNVKQIQ